MIVLLIALAAVLVPLLLTAVAPSASQRVLGAIVRALSAHGHKIGIVACFGFGASLLVRGIGGAVGALKRSNGRPHPV